MTFFKQLISVDHSKVSWCLSRWNIIVHICVRAMKMLMGSVVCLSAVSEPLQIPDLAPCWCELCADASFEKTFIAHWELQSQLLIELFSPGNLPRSILAVSYSHIVDLQVIVCCFMLVALNWCEFSCCIISLSSRYWTMMQMLLIKACDPLDALLNVNPAPLFLEVWSG